MGSKSTLQSRLKDWWETAFSSEERAYVSSVFQPLSYSLKAPEGALEVSPSPANQEISFPTQNAGTFLSALAGWFKKRSEDRELALRIVSKAEETSRAENDVLSLHFSLQQRIQINYRWRDVFPDALDQAITACHEQIALAPRAAAFRLEYSDKPLPSHVGYEQLAIILDKRQLFDEGVRLCREAVLAGWAGTWDRANAR